MENDIHPIMLEKVFFTRSVVVAVQGHRPGEQKLSIIPENRIDLAAIEGEPGRFVATMRTQMNQNGDPAAPYIIDMECIAMLAVDSAIDPEEAERGVVITAHSVLYGAIREAVSWITGRQPYGPLTLGLSIIQSDPPDAEK